MVLDPNLICGTLYRTGDAVATTSGYTCVLQPLHVHGCPKLGLELVVDNKPTEFHVDFPYNTHALDLTLGL